MSIAIAGSRIDENNNAIALKIAIIEKSYIKGYLWVEKGNKSSFQEAITEALALCDTKEKIIDEIDLRIENFIYGKVHDEERLSSRVRELEEHLRDANRGAERNLNISRQMIQENKALEDRVHELEEENRSLKNNREVDTEMLNRYIDRCKRYEEDEQQWEKHSLTEILIERNRLKEENRRLREGLEEIADTENFEGEDAARLKDFAKSTLAQAARKEGE